MNSAVTGARPSPPREASTGRHRPRISARAVSSYVPRLTRKAFEKYGFATVALLTDWSSIVGADIASFTAPERLKWPRGVDAFDDVEAGNERRPGATLVVRVDGPRAIELQHRARQIIERINASFGYRAVAELRFVQAPIGGAPSPSRQPPLPSPRPDVESGYPPELSAIEDEGLRNALTRLQASMRRENAGRAPSNPGAWPQPLTQA